MSMSKSVRPGTASMAGDGFGEGPFEPELTRDAWGELPLRLDSFTSSDRCAALRHFVADERVITAVAQAQAVGR